MNKQILIGVVVTAAFAGGATAGYLVAKKRLEDEYAAQSAKEISEARVFYKKAYKDEEFGTPEKAAETLANVPKESPSVLVNQTIRKEYEAQLSRYHDIPPSVEVAEEDEDEESDDCAGDTLENPFVYEEELKNRSPDVPYIVTLDEFVENENDYQQSTVTYFEEDDILVDEKDDPIPNYGKLIGADSVFRFGHGSDQEHTVYIRNEKLDLDFEILRNTGSYAKEVLGFEHSDRRQKVRKFRGDDE